MTSEVLLPGGQCLGGQCVQEAGLAPSGYALQRGLVTRAFLCSALGLVTWGILMHWTTPGAHEPDSSWNSEPGSVSGYPPVCGTSGGLWGLYESGSPPSLAGHLCQAGALCFIIPCSELCEYLFSLPTLISFPF